MLLRLAYLGVTNTIALLRLLPITTATRNTEILTLRHQISVLQRQLHGQVRFTPADRACPHTTVITIPGTSYFIPNEHPERIADLVVALDRAD